MVTTVKNLLGIRTNAQKAQAQQQAQAQAAQTRAANSAMEEAAVNRAQQSASGRMLRGTGRRALAFMGSELGVSDSLAATGPA
jgi:hypothetical protein